MRHTLDLQGCFDGWFVFISSHMNPRIHGFPAEWYTEQDDQCYSFQLPLVLCCVCACRSYLICETEHACSSLPVQEEDCWSSSPGH